MSVDLEGTRLVGFGVSNTDTDDVNHILSICPLRDTGICDEAEFEVNVRDMLAYIGEEIDTQYFVNDTVSAYYGALDGSAFCRAKWSYSISNQPIWL